MTTSIARSHGGSTGTGHIAGGGYSGATPELDDAAERCAALLRDAYDRDVTIRFNSDRRSGGAWLVTDQGSGVGSNADVGLNVSLVDLAWLRQRVGDAGAARAVANDGFTLDDAPAQYLRYSAYIGTRALRDPAVANNMVDKPGSRYAYRVFPSPEAALDWVQENAVAPGLEPRVGLRR